MSLFIAAVGVVYHQLITSQSGQRFSANHAASPLKFLFWGRALFFSVSQGICSTLSYSEYTLSSEGVAGGEMAHTIYRNATYLNSENINGANRLT